MKYSKFFLAACLAAFALNASAQDETVETAEPTASMSTKSASKGDYDHGYHLMPEIKLGGYNGVFGFGANLVLEHEFHRYFAWDIVSLDFSAPFNFKEGSLSLKTGLRYFTPRFWSGKVRGFVGAAVGYQGHSKEVPNSCEYKKEWTSYELNPDGTTYYNSYYIHSKRKIISGFGASVSIGIQIKKHFFLSYTLEYSGISYTPSITGINGINLYTEKTEMDGKTITLVKVKEDYGDDTIVGTISKVGGFFSHFGKVGYRF